MSKLLHRGASRCRHHACLPLQRTESRWSHHAGLFLRRSSSAKPPATPSSHHGGDKVSPGTHSRSRPTIRQSSTTLVSAFPRSSRKIFYANNGSTTDRRDDGPEDPQPEQIAFIQRLYANGKGISKEEITQLVLGKFLGLFEGRPAAMREVLVGNAVEMYTSRHATQFWVP